MSRVSPILFNTDMVRAILDGRKTVTRRVMKPQPLFRAHRKFIFADEECPKKWENCDDIIDTYQYQPGDILYVRETWCNVNIEGVEPEYYYYADVHICEDYNRTEWKWRPSIHMPKAAARIWLKVTDVRAERLQDIGEDGVNAEGAEPLIQCPLEHATIEPDGTTGDMCWNADCCKQCDYINKSYGELFGEIVWNSTIKKSDLDRYGWEANPWVWVIEFERCEKPEGN